MHNFTILRENFYDSGRKRGCPLYISFPFFARLSMQGIISNVSSWEIRKVKAKYGLVKAFIITGVFILRFYVCCRWPKKLLQCDPWRRFLDIAIAPFSHSQHVLRSFKIPCFVVTRAFPESLCLFSLPLSSYLCWNQFPFLAFSLVEAKDLFLRCNI